MKKFNIKGVLDGIRGGSINQPSRPESEVEEILRPEHFQVVKTVRHGFPHQPTALAYDPVQRILAVGTKTGSLRIFGRPGVDSHVRHESDDAVIQILFLINEGFLVTVCAGDSLHKWDLRQKKPEIKTTLKFQRERITCCELPFKSRWLYIGTERGNVHVVNIETLNLSGYVINWNKAIELSRKTHPGPVVHLSDNPVDPNKLLIGFESGSVALWDLRNKSADARYQNNEPLKSISWHHEGKQFMCSHSDGSLTTWNIRVSPKPVSVLYPHAKTQKDGKLETCKPINKVEWKSHRAGDSFIIFSGGLTYDRAGRTPCITVIHGKTTTVLEMEHNVVDFISLCETPWQSDYQNPYAIVVLLHNDLVVVDLTTSGYSCFENPYPMDLHESAVTCCFYLAACPADLIPALYSVGSKSFKRSGFSEKEWPINGGAWSATSCSYAEVIITGHADGSLKFWDASAVSLQILYKLKTAKVFEKTKSKSFDGQDEDPFAIHHISLCPESRILCIAGASSHVMVFRFSKQESLSETSFIEIPIHHEIDDELDCSPECEYPPRPIFQQGASTSSSEEARRSKIGGSHESSVEYHYPLRVKAGPQKRPAGYQPDLVCLTPWVNGEVPGHITSVGINSSYGLLAYGNETGLVIVDIIQKTCLLNMGTPDLYGSSDPYQRIPRSPKRNQSDNNYCDQGERCRSPTSVDQTLKNVGPTDPPSSSSSSLSASPSVEITYKIELIKSKSEDSSMAANVENQTSEIIGGNCLKLPSLANKAQSTNSIPTQNLLSKAALSFSSAEKSSPEESADKENKHDCLSDLGKIDDDKKFKRQRSYSWKGFSFKKKPVEKKARQSISGNSSPSSNVKPFPDDAHKKRLSLFSPLSGNLREEATSSKSIQKSQRKGCKSSRTDPIIDLRNSSDGESPVSPVTSIMKLLSVTSKDKIDSSFSRSRSSSMSSLENITSEAIQCLVFADSFSRKTDNGVCPTLWVGTSLGSVLVIIVNLPPTAELRQTQPVIVSPSGTIFRLKGAIQCLAFLDWAGTLVPYAYESWKDPTKESKGEKDREKSVASAEIRDRQFVVISSEKQARVIALPSQTCAYKAQVTDSSFIVKVDVMNLKESICLACYIANGHIAIFSLPSLRILMDVEFVPLIDLSCQTSEQGTVDPMISIWGKQLYHSCESDQTARTFCFSSYGHGMYLCSPCEIQKFTVLAEFCENFEEMLGDLYQQSLTPEPPKEGFFKGLFGAGVRSLDREELFGDASGKPSRSIAKHIAPNTNLEHLSNKATGVSSEIARAHKAAVERGEHLGQLEDTSAMMLTQAEQFQQGAHQLKNKYKDRKWYQF